MEGRSGSDAHLGRIAAGMRAVDVCLLFSSSVLTKKISFAKLPPHFVALPPTVAEYKVPLTLQHIFQSSVCYYICFFLSILLLVVISPPVIAQLIFPAYALYPDCYKSVLPFLVASLVFVSCLQHNLKRKN